MINTILNDQIKINITGSIWLQNTNNNERFLGKGRIELLQLIVEHGSISKAAQAMEMSYKRAWDLITSMNSQSKKPFVITQTGGKKGGGAIVSAEGLEAIEYFKTLQIRFQAFLDMENQNV